MRTTVTLDADVEARLKKAARERGTSFKVVLNDAVRAGLNPGAGTSRPYKTPSRPMGLRDGIDLDSALGLAEDLEDAEIARKLDLRK